MLSPFYRSRHKTAATHDATLSWRYLAPRVLAVILGLVVLDYALSSAARMMVVRALSSVTGLHVAVDHARVFLNEQQVVLGGLSFIAPANPAQKQIAAEYCELDVNAGTVLSDQMVIESALVTGLWIADSRPATRATRATMESGELAAAWLEQTEDRLQQQLGDQLASVQQVELLCRRYETKRDALRARLEQLEARAAELQETAEAARANPLRHETRAKTLASSAESLRREFELVSRQIEGLPESFDAERRAAIAARQQDEVLVQKHLQFEPIDASALSAYLLHQQVAEPVDELVNVLQWLREAVPPGRRDAPAGSNFIVRELHFRGTAQLRGEPIELTGLATNVASRPSRQKQPLRLQLTTSGAHPIELRAVLDRTGDIPREELAITCQQLAQSTWTLGDPQRLPLVLKSTGSKLTVRVSAVGDELEGDIQLVQPAATLARLAEHGTGSSPEVVPLANAPGEPRSLVTRLALRGSLEEPFCTIQSDLGPFVAETIHRSVREAAHERAQAVLAAAKRHVDERLTEVDRQIAGEQRRLAANLQSVARSVEQIAEKSAAPGGLRAERIGHGLPETSRFR